MLAYADVDASWSILGPTSYLHSLCPESRQPHGQLPSFRPPILGSLCPALAGGLAKLNITITEQSETAEQVEECFTGLKCISIFSCQDQSKTYWYQQWTSKTPGRRLVRHVHRLSVSSLLSSCSLLAEGRDKASTREYPCSLVLSRLVAFYLSQCVLHLVCESHSISLLQI